MAESIPRLHITNAIEAYCPRGWHWDSRRAPYRGFDLWFIRSGSGVMQTCGQRVELVPGLCFLLRGRDHQVAWHDPQRPLIVPFAIFHTDDDESALADYPLYRRLDEPEFFYGLFQRLIRLQQAGRLHAPEAQDWLRALLHEFRGHERPDRAGIAPETYERIRQLTLALRHERVFTARIGQLAARAGFSLDHFIRLFKSATGQTPAQWLIEFRMEEARNLLRYSPFAISRIARELAYPDVYSFSRQFARRHGCSPTQYRRTGEACASARTNRPGLL